VRDGRGARVQRDDATAAPRGLDGKVAQAAAAVEYPAAQVGQCGLLEWIEPEVGLAYLTLELRVEEIDARIGNHDAVGTRRTRSEPVVRFIDDNGTPQRGRVDLPVAEQGNGGAR